MPFSCSLRYDLCDGDIPGPEGFVDAFQAQMSRDVIGDATHVLVDTLAMGDVCW